MSYRGPKKTEVQWETLSEEEYKKEVRTFVTNGLRRLSYRWPPRYMTLKKAHKARNAYECEMCKGIFTKKEIQMDHKHPVIDPLKGFTNLDDLAHRMMAPMGNWSALCETCHKKKSFDENQIRKEVRVKKERPKRVVKKKSTKKARKK